jgi:glutamine amidotransferase
MQLLMERSYEFGEHEGLGLIKGSVVRFDNPRDDSGRVLKVPQVGWNTIYKVKSNSSSWGNSLLREVPDNEFMYFVHSYYVIPDDSRVCVSLSRYGDVEFCSSIQYRNIFACQFHPERSGRQGITLYRELARCSIK